MIEVRYAGAVVGRSAIVRELDTNGLFLGITEPMPVGTSVTLKIGEQTVEGKVAVVSESQELARAGMRVKFSDPAAAKLFGTPTEVPPEPVVEPVPSKAPEAAAPVVTPIKEEEVSKATAARNTSGPRRIVVDASTENLPVTPAQAPEVIDASGPVTTPASSNDPHRKNRRTKRR